MKIFSSQQTNEMFGLGEGLKPDVLHMMVFFRAQALRWEALLTTARVFEDNDVEITLTGGRSPFGEEGEYDHHFALPNILLGEDVIAMTIDSPGGYRFFCKNDTKTLYYDDHKFTLVETNSRGKLKKESSWNLSV